MPSVTLEKSFFTITTRPLLLGSLVGRTRAPGLRSASVLMASEEFPEGLIPKESGGTHPVSCWGSGFPQGEQPMGFMTRQAGRHRGAAWWKIPSSSPD